MANNWIINQTIDLQKGVDGIVVWPHALLVTGDSKAHVWNVTVVDGGKAASLTGDVTAYFVRADGATVYQTGKLTKNVASVTLPVAAYAYEGDLNAVMRITDGTNVTTLSSLLFRVRNIATDMIVDPGKVVPVNQLYSTTGQNTDGAMTQKATTDALDNKLNITGGTLTGELTANRGIKLGTTSNTGNLQFQRQGYNYITSPSGDSTGIAMLVSNDSVSYANSQLVVGKDSVYPGTNKSVDLGQQNKMWNNVWADKINANSIDANGATINASISGHANSAAYLEVSGVQRLNVSSYEGTDGGIHLRNEKGDSVGGMFLTNTDSDGTIMHVVDKSLHNIADVFSTNNPPYLGNANSILTSSSQDTPSFWTAKKLFGYFYVNSSILTNQPASTMIVLNLSNHSSICAQIGFSNGHIDYRWGTGSGWTAWTRVV